MSQKMEYNVAQLLKESPGASRDHTLDQEMAFDEGAPERVWGKLRFMRTTEGVWARVVVDVKANLTCSRCLRPFSQTLHLAFDEEYLPTVDVNSGLALDVPKSEEEESLTIDGQHMLDLYEAVRQYRIAEAPMKALCRPDCRGLCPVCGARLYEGDCQCQRKVADPRWAALRDLLTSDK